MDKDALSAGQEVRTLSCDLKAGSLKVNMVMCTALETYRITGRIKIAISRSNNLTLLKNSVHV